MHRQPEDEPRSSDHYTQGLYLYRLGYYDEAVSQLKPLQNRRDLTGRLARYYEGMAHRAMGIDAMCEGRYDVAEHHLRMAMGSIGRQADLASYLGALYAQTDRHDACAREMDEVLSRQPDSAVAWRRLAQAQWRAGQREQAYMTLASGIGQVEAKAILYMQLGVFYAAEEELDRARQNLALAVECDCTNSDAHYYLGLTAAASGDVRAAVRCFQRAFELRPDDLMLCFQLALSARAAGLEGGGVIIRMPEMSAPLADSQVRQLAGYITADPDFVDAFVALPESDVDAELFDMLAGVLRIALGEHPNYADLHLRCSRVYQRLDRIAPAVEHAKRAVEINPDYVEALLQLGRLHAEEGRRDDAADCVARAIEKGADWPDIHCFAGELLLQGDTPGEPRPHLERAMELKPGYTRAAEALALLRDGAIPQRQSGLAA